MSNDKTNAATKPPKTGNLTKISDLPYFIKWFILGIVIGVVAGASALAFYFAVKFMEHVFLGLLVGASIPEPLGEGGSLTSGFRAVRYWLIPISTTLGGLLSGLIVYTWAPEAEGHGREAVRVGRGPRPSSVPASAQQ